MQKNEGVLFLFKRDRFEEIFGWHWYVCLKKNKHQHIAFKIRIWDYDSFGKLIHFISDKWEKRKVFFEKYKIIYPRLISLLKWKFDYVFLKARRKMKNQILENLCNKIVDVVHETFTRKYYFVKISQSKKGHIYLTVRKKRGRLFGVEKNKLHKKIFQVSASVFQWYYDKHDFLGKKYFINPKMIKDVSGYHFHYFLVSCSKYVSDYFWTVFVSNFGNFLVCSDHFLFSSSDF